jgi:hypothetical protein
MLLVSFYSLALLSLKYSRKVTYKGSLDENFARKGMLLGLFCRVMGRGKITFFFLSLYLYPLLNEGMLCVDVGYAYPSIF